MAAATSAEIVPTICRLCIAHCGVLATVEDDGGRRRLSKVTGDPDNPVFEGYTCPKGRALPEMHNHDGRLLQSVKRNEDGSHTTIDNRTAAIEVAQKIRAIVDEYGPRAVAMYVGTPNVAYPAAAGMGNAFMRAIGSNMFFTSNTIDQPGKQIAMAMHGKWLGGEPDFAEADVWMLLGVNPIISKAAGIPGQNPAQKLKDAVKRGMQVIVIDPRVSETARRAKIHLQCRPGEDHAVLAGMINIIISEHLYDAEFVADNVNGFDALREHVAPFTPAYVAERADIPEDQLIAAARLFAKAAKKHANSGTGGSFAMHCNLKEYLLLNLNSICGAWAREGERVTRPNAMLPGYTPKAQAFPPFTGWGYGEKMRVRGLTDAACGMPTAALADEILLEGEGQVKALICVGGNPMAAWPDQVKTQKAMEKLDLLVTFEVEMTSTARLAHYALAAKQTLETPGMSQGAEMIKFFGTGIGFNNAYAQYSPRISDPPAGSDVVEEWEFFYDMAAHLDLEMYFVSYFGFSKYKEAPPAVMVINKDHRPTTEEIYENICANSRIPLAEVKQFPHGHVFDGDVFIEQKETGCEARLDVGNERMLTDLDAIFAEDFHAEQNTPDFPFRYIQRRHNNFMNSNGRSIKKLTGATTWNPAWIHPDDLEALGVKAGDSVKIDTGYDSIPAVVEADDTLRRGLVAMSHAFGGLADEDHRYKELGSNTGRLVRSDVDYDPITGMPKMGNIPVAITPL